MKVVKVRHNNITAENKRIDHHSYRYRCYNCGSTLEVDGEEIEYDSVRDTINLGWCPVCGAVNTREIFIKFFHRVW